MGNTLNYSVENIKRREVAIALLLTVVTCGIYMIYWFVKITNDSNAVAKQFGTGKVTASGGKAILFTIITCGLYYLYWSYQLAKKLNHNCLKFLVLSLFFGGIANYFEAQTELNYIYDELQRRKTANPDSLTVSSDSVNPFTTFSKADFVATGLPGEVYDYCISLKPGDIILKILCENDDYTFELYNGDVKCTFARKNFGLIPRIEDDNPELYIALTPLTEPLRSMTDRVLFKAEKGEDGFTVLKAVTDEQLIKELQEESERQKARLASARKS